jgi:hypothetical protein
MRATSPQRARLKVYSSSATMSLSVARFTGSISTGARYPAPTGRDWAIFKRPLRGLASEFHGEVRK